MYLITYSDKIIKRAYNNGLPSEEDNCFLIRKGAAVLRKGVKKRDIGLGGEMSNFIFFIAVIDDLSLWFDLNDEYKFN